MTRVHTPDPGDERPGATGIHAGDLLSVDVLAGTLLNKGTAQGLEASPTRRRWSRSAVGIDPVMIALLAFWCTILIRVALAGSQ